MVPTASVRLHANSRKVTLEAGITQAIQGGGVVQEYSE